MEYNSSSKNSQSTRSYSSSEVSKLEKSFTQYIRDRDIYMFDHTRSNYLYNNYTEVNAHAQITFGNEVNQPVPRKRTSQRLPLIINLWIPGRFILPTEGIVLEGRIRRTNILSG